MSYLMGLDVGTTSTRCIIINGKGELIHSAIKDYPIENKKKGWSEQNAELWWNASVCTIREVLKRSEINVKNISAIGLTGQMHSSVFIDKYGDVIRPAILWCDQRTVPQCNKIHNIFGGKKEFIKLSYNKALAGFTAPKILWLREEEPNNYKKLVKILLPKDYIRYRLSGSFATDVSDASGTVLFNIKDRKWSDEIISGLSIDRDFLPEAFESAEITSYVSKEAAEATGLIQGLPIVAGAGDQAAGAVGSGIVCEGLISDCLGTSGVVFAHSNTPIFDPKGRLHSFCHAVKNSWHLMGVTLSAAGSYKWYYENFGISNEVVFKKGLSEYELLNEQAGQSPPGSEGLIFLPYLSGERTPYSDPYARGVFFGISYIHKPSHFARAVMEGVSFSQYDCLNIMKDLGITSDRVVLFGGGSNSEIWRHITADIFNIKIITLNIKEGPAYGAAVIAGVGSGIYEDVEGATRLIIKEDVETLPNSSNAEKYSRYYEVYRALYKNLKGTFKNLATL